MAPGECFETPEAVMAFSPCGYAELSRRMHRFVNAHIIPAYWQGRERPVLFNSWEGCMFDFSHRKLVSLARDAAELGCELFVLDALLVFVGQAFIQALMLMFLSDTVEYGQWKLGKRNEAITFSVQPLINKLGGALATGIVSMTLILSGIKVDETTAAAIGPDGQLILKVAMFAIPLLMIIAGYIVYLKKYRITEEYYANMLKGIEALEGSGPAGKA